MPRGSRKTAGASARPDELSAALRSAREAIGITLSRAAQRTGITPAALHFLETGKCQPSLRTMGAMLEAMPELAPIRQLALGGAEDTMVPSGRGGFLAAADAFGMSCDRIEISRSEARIEGLRPTLADATDEAVRRALMRVACVGDGKLKRRLSADDTTVQDGKHQHFFAWNGDSLDYRCTGPRRLEWTCLVPARELLFRATKPLSVSVRSETGGPELGDALHPRRESIGKGLARVDFPVVGVVYEAGFKGVPWDAPLGLVMRHHREGAGLTQKQVAEAAGVRMTSVSAFETGGIEWPRVDHVAGYLRALPEFPPQRALPGPDISRRPSPEEAFDQAVQLTGLVCDEVEKQIRITPDGTQYLRTAIRGLRSLGQPLAERGLVLPGLPSSPQLAPDTIARISGDLEQPVGAFTRDYAFPGGALRIRWAKRKGIFGTTFTCEYEPVPDAYAMTEAEAAARHGELPPIYSGATLPVRVPAAKAVLRVQLPRTPSHCDVGAHLWASAVFPDMTLPPLLVGALRPLAVANEGAELEYTAAAEAVLPGQKLAIGWRPQADG